MTLQRLLKFILTSFFIFCFNIVFAQSDWTVNSNTSVSGKRTVNNLTVKNGATLTIGEGDTLIVKGNVDNQGSTIIVQGALIINGNYENNSRGLLGATGSKMDIRESGSFFVNGDFINNSVSTVENSGKMEIGGDFTNEGFWFLIDIHGNTGNDGGMLIHGDLNNSGDFVNDGDIWVEGEIDNTGNFDNEDGNVYTDDPNPDIGGNIQPLPVELMSFYGRQSGQSVELTWTTATETNNDYFTIEKSVDTKDFIEIGNVKGSGTTAFPVDYAWKDDSPANGVNYYRLKQTDFNGEYNYLETVSVYVDGVERHPQLSVYPNPVVHGGTALVKAIGLTSEARCRLRVLDNQGALVLEIEASVDEFGSMSYSIAVDHRFQPGFYIVAVHSGDGVQRAKVLIR